MKYCSKCGKEIMEEAVVCPACGCAQENKSIQAEEDKGGFGWGFLGFCIPVVGLILYLIWKGEKPLTAKAAGKGALISVIASAVFYIIYAIILGTAIGTGMMYY